MDYNFTPFPVLETERLTLRALNLDDAKAIFGLRTNKEVNEYIDRKVPRNLSEARAFIDRISTLAENNKGIFWVIASKSTNELMGTIGLRNFEDEEYYAEIGYEINPDYQERGYMSEAFIPVLEYGFQNLELKTIEAFTHKNNTASIALLEKLNFVFDPEREDEGFENNISYILRS
ncbi:GNAT family N-acetyltransferase [Polaribacter vadi]|uniref:GNAT family N-acetyltransferase n=1 Tax=Polaribacter vadi TaxID=1774273 RepID=UPI0030EF866B|tara:strand:- start:1091 stop:1618 length:528 start_codon:yes stop_codon:yes gene_type:complete